MNFPNGVALWGSTGSCGRATGRAGFGADGADCASSFRNRSMISIILPMPCKRRFQAAVVRLMDRPPQGRSGAPADPATSSAPWKIYNVGNNRPEDLMDVVSLLEKEFGRTAIKEMLPMQPGDVEATYADIAELERDIGFRPSTTIDEGVARFVKWYREY